MNLLKTRQAERLWNKRFVQLVAIETLYTMSAYLTNPVISEFAVSLGASIAVGSAIAGLMALTSLVARPITGWLADRLGKKHLLACATIMLGVACFGCAFSTSLAAITFFRILQGFAFAFKSAVVVSLISLSVPSTRLGQAVGWAGLAQTVSMSIGPLIGASIVDSGGFRASFLTAGCFFVVAIAIVFMFKSPSSSSSRAKLADQQASGGEAEDTARGEEGSDSIASARIVPTRKGFHIRDFVYLPNILVATVVCLVAIPHGVAVTLILSVGAMRGIDEVSVYFTAYALTALFTKPIAGRLTDVRGTRFVLLPSLFIEFLAVAVMALMGSVWEVIIAGILMGAGHASAYSALQAASVRDVPQEELGRASNTFYIGADIGMGIGPIMSGFVLQRLDAATMFWTDAALVAIAFGFVALRGVRKQGKTRG